MSNATAATARELVFEVTDQGDITSFIRGKPAATNAKPEACVPREFLNRLSAANPGLWKLVDDVRRRMIAEKKGWPEWCFLPDWGWTAVAIENETIRHKDFSPTGTDFVEHMYRAKTEQTFFGTWRLTQGAYRFDPTLYKALLETPLTGNIPSEILTRLPEWAVYIETPDIKHPSGMPLDGFGACLCHEPTLGDWIEFHLFVAMPDGSRQRGSHSVVLNGGTIEESGKWIDGENALVSEFLGTANPTSPFDEKAWTPFVGKLLSLLLWLCSEEPEIGSGTPPKLPTPVRTKKGQRFFPAAQPKVWDVGVRIGAALNAAAAIAKASGDEEDEADPRARPRGHIRRAHWHTYRTGPGGSVRKLRWMSPILVNMRTCDDLPAVIHPVIN
jgi:hypothetical protein